MVFVVERRTTNVFLMKQYRILPGCGLVYRDHENFSTNWPNVHCSRKFYPPKNTLYTVLCEQLSVQEIPGPVGTKPLCEFDQTLVFPRVEKQGSGARD